MMKERGIWSMVTKRKKVLGRSALSEIQKLIMAINVKSPLHSLLLLIFYLIKNRLVSKIILLQ